MIYVTFLNSEDARMFAALFSDEKVFCDLVTVTLQREFH